MWSKSRTNCFPQLLNPQGIFRFKINSGQQQSWFQSLKSVRSEAGEERGDPES